MNPQLRSLIVLVHGCGPLGRALADGLFERGYRAVSLDNRTAAGTAEARRVDMRSPDAVRRELLGLARERGPAHAIVLLPRHGGRPETGAWEWTAAQGLLEATTIVRAAPTVLRPEGRVVLVPARSQADATGGYRTTPIEAIVELGVAGVAMEEGVPLVRCLLSPVDEVGRRELTDQLLTATNGPGRRDRAGDVGMPRSDGQPVRTHASTEVSRRAG